MNLINKRNTYTHMAYILKISSTLVTFFRFHVILFYLLIYKTKLLSFAFNNLSFLIQRLFRTLTTIAGVLRKNYFFLIQLIIQ